MSFKIRITTEQCTSGIKHSLYLNLVKFFTSKRNCFFRVIAHVKQTRQLVGEWVGRLVQKDESRKRKKGKEKKQRNKKPFW